MATTKTKTIDMSAEYKVEYREGQDLEGCRYVIPTVWIGNQGFDLMERYADDPMTADEKAEWFASMFKKAIDNYAKAYHKAELEKVKCERTRHNEDIFNHGYCLKCESKLKQ